MITGLGPHHFDTAHWGMNLEHSGPSKIEGMAEFPTNKSGMFMARITSN